jgi:hypothetical protein
MTEITNINVNPPDPDVVKFISNLLRQAKSGQIQSVAAVIGYPNNHTGNGWAGMNKSNMAMVGETEALKTELISCFISSRVDEI